MRVEGSCHCGNVSYEAEVDPGGVAICHCTDCQMLTGSAFRVSVRAPAETFRLLSGRLQTYVKTAESGTKRIHAFCPNCGTPVYACAIEKPSTFSLRVGCLKQRAELPPKLQIWHSSALPWSSDLSAVAMRDRG